MQGAQGTGEGALGTTERRGEREKSQGRESVATAEKRRDLETNVWKERGRRKKKRIKEKKECAREKETED